MASWFWPGQARRATSDNIGVQPGARPGIDGGSLYAAMLAAAGTEGEPPAAVGLLVAASPDARMLVAWQAALAEVGWAAAFLLRPSWAAGVRWAVRHLAQMGLHEFGWDAEDLARPGLRPWDNEVALGQHVLGYALGGHGVAVVRLPGHADLELIQAFERRGLQRLVREQVCWAGEGGAACRGGEMVLLSASDVTQVTEAVRSLRTCLHSGGLSVWPVSRLYDHLRLQAAAAARKAQHRADVTPGPAPQAQAVPVESRLPADAEPAPPPPPPQPSPQPQPPAPEPQSVEPPPPPAQPQPPPTEPDASAAMAEAPPAEPQPPPVEPEAAPSPAPPPVVEGPLRLDGVEAAIRSLVGEAKAVGFASLVEFGHSTLGRSLHAVRLGQGERAIALVAGQHGCDGRVVMALLRAGPHLLQPDHPVAEALRAGRLTLWWLPLVNPDGLELATSAGLPERHPYRYELVRWNQGSTSFRHWRANARGVDLERQYAADWERVRQRSPAAPAPAGYPGPYPESEAESRAVATFVRSHALHMVVVFGGRAPAVGWEFHGRAPAPAEGLARKWAKRLGDIAPAGRAAYAPGATLKDWILQEWGYPAFAVEVGELPAPELLAAIVTDAVDALP